MAKKSKVISLVLAVCLSGALLTGCDGYYNGKIKLFNLKINGKEQSLFEFGGEKFPKNVEKAYELFQEQGKKYEDDTKKFVKDSNGIGFEEELKKEDKGAFCSENNKINIVSDIKQLAEDGKENKEILEKCGIDDVDYFNKLICDDETLIEIRNDRLMTLELGNDELEQEVINEVLGNNPTTDDKEEEKSLTCDYCGKKYKKSNSNASTPSKYCSNNCEKKHKEVKKDKKYYCRDCKTQISKSQYDNHNGRCPSCARSYAKSYDCKNCGRAITKETYNNYNGLCDRCYEAKKETKKYYCKVCGLETTKESYDSNAGKCPSCARTYAKEHEATLNCSVCGEPVRKSVYYDQNKMCRSCYAKWYEELNGFEDDGSNGGQTLCGWCEKPIPDSAGAFCSKDCEAAFRAHQNN